VGPEGRRKFPRRITDAEMGSVFEKEPFCSIGRPGLERKKINASRGKRSKGGVPRSFYIYG